MDKITQGELTSLDRCDRCGAQALYRLSLLEMHMSLDLCGHDFRKNAPNMFAAKWIITASGPSHLTGTTA
jgi:uncharacterized protein (DUF983 family)